MRFAERAGTIMTYCAAQRVPNTKPMVPKTRPFWRSVESEWNALPFISHELGRGDWTLLAVGYAMSERHALALERASLILAHASPHTDSTHFAVSTSLVSRPMGPKAPHGVPTGVQTQFRLLEHVNGVACCRVA